MSGLREAAQAVVEDRLVRFDGGMIYCKACDTQDGHEPDCVIRALDAALASPAPTLDAPCRECPRDDPHIHCAYVYADGVGCRCTEDDHPDSFDHPFKEAPECRNCGASEADCTVAGDAMGFRCCRACDHAAPAPALDAERRLLVGLIASALLPVDEEGNLAADVAEGLAESFFATRGDSRG